MVMSKQEYEHKIGRIYGGSDVKRGKDWRILSRCFSQNVISSQNGTELVRGESRMPVTPVVTTLCL